MLVWESEFTAAPLHMQTVLAARDAVPGVSSLLSTGL